MFDLFKKPRLQKDENVAPKEVCNITSRFQEEAIASMDCGEEPDYEWMNDVARGR